MFGAVQAIGGAFACGAINQALTGYPSTNNATDTILLYMTEFGGTRFEYGYASAMSVFLMAAMLIIYRLFTKVLKSFGAD